MSDRLLGNLYGLYAQQQGASWGVGIVAERELLKARDGFGLCLTGPGYVPPTLFGMRVLIDPTLPEGRIELRDRSGRVLGAIENIGRAG